MTCQEFYTDESKWVKHALYLGPAACLLGALSMCYGTKPLYTAALGRVVDALIKLVGNGQVSAYNDAPLTTFADIQRLVKVANV